MWTWAPSATFSWPLAYPSLHWEPPRNRRETIPEANMVTSSWNEIGRRSKLPNLRTRSKEDKHRALCGTKAAAGTCLLGQLMAVSGPDSALSPSAHGSGAGAPLPARRRHTHVLCQPWAPHMQPGAGMETDTVPLVYLVFLFPLPLNKCLQRVDPLA